MQQRMAASGFKFKGNPRRGDMESIDVVAIDTDDGINNSNEKNDSGNKKYGDGEGYKIDPATASEGLASQFPDAAPETNPPEVESMILGDTNMSKKTEKIGRDEHKGGKGKAKKKKNKGDKDGGGGNGEHTPLIIKNKDRKQKKSKHLDFVLSSSTEIDSSSSSDERTKRHRKQRGHTTARNRRRK